MCRFRERLYLCYREASAHVSPDGVINLLMMQDIDSWANSHVFTIDNMDLRDPKLFVWPDGSLCLLAAGVVRERNKPILLNNYVWHSADGEEWHGPFLVAEQDMWLWRVTWRDGYGYGLGYCVGARREQPRFVSLYRTTDGLDYELWVDHVFAEGYPNEHGMIFDDDGRAWCLLRRDDESLTAMLGSAMPPYKDWAWRPLGVLLGGPQMLRGPDGRVWVGARLYDGVIRTSLCTLDLASAKLDEVLVLPSGGDCSYPDMAWLENGDMLMSYYSSHEGSSRVYVATIRA